MLEKPFMLATSLGLSAMTKPVLMLLPLGHLSKHSLTLHGLTIADTQAGQLGGMVLPVSVENNRLTWAPVPVCFGL